MQDGGETALKDTIGRMSDTDGKKPLRPGWRPPFRTGEAKLQPWPDQERRGRDQAQARVVPDQAAQGPLPRRQGLPPTTAPRLGGDPSKRPAGISDAEMERRMAALRAAKVA